MNDQERTSPKRLVLCFDGTGNKFSGDDSDTNIVKIYRMLGRECPDQYHYYQPGIGTYAQNQTSNSSTPRGLFSRLKTSIELSIDQAIGTSFVHHVLARYRFLMRYYSTGDQIYIFGFSRGAYTARFLAEMVFEIGLLSRGNEEMVHFAWNTFSDYQKTRSDTEAVKEKKEYMKQFMEPFCRPEVRVYFLGLFDCVNSVGQFEIPLFRKSSPYIPIPPALHTRHAVSIHERRLKFKPALFQLDDSDSPKKSELGKKSDLKEVWFAGNHADIGGGWERVDSKRLLSDIPLEWMIKEVQSLKDDDHHMAIDDAHHLAIDDRQKKKILKTTGHGYNDPHDMLARGPGTSKLGVLGWWILEILPFFTRLELEDREWVPRYWPPNLGASRDIPTNALIHEDSVNKGVLKKKPVTGGDGKPASLKFFALAPLFALGILGAGIGIMNGKLF